MSAALVAGTAAVGAGAASAAEPDVKPRWFDIRHPNKSDVGHAKHAKRRSRSGSNGIAYHGGPLVLGTTNVYYIWYGDWSGNTATTILTDLASGIGGSPYYNINTTYYDGTKTRVSNSVHFAEATTDNYSQGKSFGDAGVRAIVSSAISSSRLPSDPNGVYIVLTSQDVNETSGFGTQYCGWHAHTSTSGADVKYAFVGDPTRYMNACAAQSVGPNGNAAADAMANIVAHELEEAVTDPDLNAWYDGRGYENADKCAWSFGSTYQTSTGAYANVKLGGRDYLIQRNWVNAGGGKCAMSY